jgi:hypothetical protein
LATADNARRVSVRHAPTDPHRGAIRGVEEQFAEFSMIDVASRRQAEEIAAAFVGPGEMTTHADLLELTGNAAATKNAFRLGARLTHSVPEQRYLN